MIMFLLSNASPERICSLYRSFHRHFARQTVRDWSHVTFVKTEARVRGSFDIRAVSIIVGAVVFQLSFELLIFAMSSGVCQEFQLRRAGNAATVMGVKDTFRHVLLVTL